MSAFFFAQWFCPCGQCYHQKVFKTITWLPLTRLQNNKPHRNSPEPSEPCLRYLHQRTPLPPEPTPAHTGTLRNLPEPAQHTPELSGTFWNLPPEPAPATRTGTHRSLSGLKTPLAYAVGEQKINNIRLQATRHQSVVYTTACFFSSKFQSKGQGAYKAIIWSMLPSRILREGKCGRKSFPTKKHMKTSKQKNPSLAN